MATQGAYTKVAVEANDGQSSPTAMGESLIAVPSAVVAASTTPMLQITAPADLPEGYEMEATVGGDDGVATVLKVQVPPGGVEKGQSFSVPFPSQVESRFLAAATIRVPVGNWRDGFFEFYKYGVCHPHCWTACCCTTLAAGQVMSRLNLDWTGKPASTAGRAVTAFTVIMAIVILYYVVRVPLGIAFWIVADDDEEFDDDTYEDEDEDGGLVMLLIMIWFCFFWILMAIVLTRVRASVRERYGIPPSFLGETLDDPVVSCCCCCFAAGQMLRHTTEYETYPATCCTRTGIPETAPSIA